MRLTSLGCAAIVGLLMAGAAAAQTICPGTLTATALAPVPPGAVLSVLLPSDDENTKALRTALFSALRRAGYRIGTPAAYALTWRSGRSDAGGAVSAADPFALRDRTANPDTVNIDLLKGVPGREPGDQPTTRRLEGTLELRDLESKRLVWSAKFSCARISSDPDLLIKALLSALVPTIGKTFREREF